MKQNGTTTGILLAPAAAAAVLIPCLCLFREGNWLYYVLKSPEMHSAWLETAVLAGICAAICLCCRSRKLRTVLLAAVFAAVSWLHGMLFPVLAAVFYFLLIISIGGFVTGSAAVILLAALLSLFHLCTPPVLLAAVFLTASVCLFLRRKAGPGRDLRSPLCRAAGLFRGSRDDIPEKDSRTDRLITALVSLVLLVQIARANECLDFDSLWYGVRSLYVLAPGGSIFDDLGLVGMVYTYPKGFEILTLPLSGTPSCTLITAFNLCVFLTGLRRTHSAAAALGGKAAAGIAAVLTVLVPGIVNMTLSAKPDMITWALQITMLDTFFRAVRSGQTRGAALELSAAYLLSLAMKPTALVFSTALFGMMVLYALFSRLKKAKAETSSAAGPADSGKSPALHRPGSRFFPAAFRPLLSFCALTAVCARTLKLTGLPFTSVFSGILEKLGFRLRYPFSASGLPQNYQEGSPVLTAVKRAVKMLLMPDGKDMSHVLIAWGGSLFFVLGIIIFTGLFRKQTGPVRRAARTVFLPFAAVCFVSLAMLYQIDGNYYMTLYSAAVLAAAAVMADMPAKQRRSAFFLPLAAVCAFQFLIMTMTNWAGSTGFTKIAVNPGYVDHRAQYREILTEEDGRIYSVLAADPQTKLVSFGTHPECLQFPCIAESYNDITSPWGNEEIVSSADAFVRYLEFFGADYVYADAEHLKEDAWQWSKGLLEEMTEQGVLYGFTYEGENWLAKVRK